MCVPDPAVTEELEQIPAAMEHIEPAAPKGHSLTRMRKLRLRDLVDVPFIWFPRREAPSCQESGKIDISTQAGGTPSRIKFPNDSNALNEVVCCRAISSDEFRKDRGV